MSALGFPAHVDSVLDEGSGLMGVSVGWRCNRQALKQCWEGGEEGRSGEMLTAKVQGFVWVLTAFLLDAAVRPETYQCVSWSLNPPGNGVCRDSALGHLAQTHPLTPHQPCPSLLSCCAPLHIQSLPPPSPAQVGFPCHRRCLCLEGLTLSRE